MKEINNQSATFRNFFCNCPRGTKSGRVWLASSGLDSSHNASGPLSNRPALANALRKSPPSLAKKFEQGEVADAYLAAYAEWISDRAGIPRPSLGTSKSTES